YAPDRHRAPEGAHERPECHGRSDLGDAVGWGHPRDATDGLRQVTVRTDVRVDVEDGVRPVHTDRVDVALPPGWPDEVAPRGRPADPGCPRGGGRRRRTAR